MFDLPETKRIRRSDLYSPSHSPSPPSALLDLNLDLEFVSTTPAPIPPASTEDEFEFNLFSSVSGRQSIKLKSPTPPPTEEALYDLAAKSQRRPLEYYILTSEEMLRRRKEWEEVAISGEEVLKQAAVPWPGCFFRWKIIHFPPQTTCTKRAKAPQNPMPSASAESSRRKKPGKKRRLHIRKEQQKLKAAEEARAKSLAGLQKYKGLSAEEREKVEREKRTRQNRERKIRKRARKRAEKMAEQGEGGRRKDDKLDVDTNGEGKNAGSWSGRA